jgi:hypothetical protein
MIKPALSDISSLAPAYELFKLSTQIPSVIDVNEANREHTLPPVRASGDKICTFLELTALSARKSHHI